MNNSVLTDRIFESPKQPLQNGEMSTILNDGATDICNSFLATANQTKNVLREYLKAGSLNNTLKNPNKVTI